jgi:hypothetical protein
MNVSEVGLRTTFSRAARTPRGLAGIAVGIAGCVLAISAAFIGQQARAGSASGVTVSTAAVGRLEQIATTFANVNGGVTPDWVTAVVTTDAKALRAAAPGELESVAAGTLVYLITMKGHFTAYGAKVPAGAPFPTGSYLSIVINARTFAVIDWAVSPTAPSISPASLGRLRYLPR